MNYITRTLEKVLPEVSESFKGVLVSGMRQVGKSTLLQHLGTGRRYVTLDEGRSRDTALSAPERFLDLYKPPITIDEVQRAPGLFPALKTYLDSTEARGTVWLSGSQRLPLWANVADKLPGRLLSLDLLPLSIYELQGKGLEQEAYQPSFDLKSNLRKLTVEETWKSVFLGGWPDVQTMTGENVGRFFDMLVDNYISKDVMQLETEEKRLDFRRFLQLLAARSGQELNYSALAAEAGCTQKRTREWISIAQAGGYIYLLPPYFENIGKRLVKSPKVYFADTGLLCHLLGFQTAEEVSRFYASGAIFETFVVMEIMKSWMHNGKRPDFYFYRDSDGTEVDLLIHSGGKYHPVEIKSTAEPKAGMTKGIQRFRKMVNNCGTAAVVAMNDAPVAFDNDTVGMSLWSI